MIWVPAYAGMTTYNLNMINLSAFIIAKNEASRIARAINSVKNIVSELIVVDSGSTDDTVKIASNLGAKVVFNEWPGYVKQKAFAEGLCKNDWTLNIDADEELSKELQDEIGRIFSANNQDKYLAYKFSVVIMHRNDLKPRFLAPDNKCLRLYNRKFSSYANSTEFTTHDSVIFNPGINSQDKVSLLNGKAYHRSGTSIEQLVSKANFYSSEQAKDLFRLGRNPTKIRVATEMIICVFKVFFIRRYFVFGFDGLVDSIIFAFARFIRLAKARELFKNEKI